MSSRKEILLEIGKRKIEPVKHIKYFGVIIDEKLRWKEQTNTLWENG